MWWERNNRGCRKSTLAPVGAIIVVGVGTMMAAAPAAADRGGALLGQINATRALNGCGPVTANPQLTAAAARHATDMLANGVRGHVGSDGSSVVQRTTDAGYAPYAAVGEVVFWSTGYNDDPAHAVTWWMNSPPHRALIIDCGMTDAGFSAVSAGDRVTAAGEFGRR